MSNNISLHPSPDHPSGGYAIVRVKDPIGVTPVAKISVYDLFRERYLGAHDWEPDAHEFGPYKTQAGPGDTAEFTIGPEIVNQISEFTNVRVEVGGHPTTLVWPEDVFQDPSAPPYGTIYKEDDTPEVDLTQQVRSPVITPETEQPDNVKTTRNAESEATAGLSIEPSDLPDPTGTLKSKRLVWIAVLLLLLLIIAIAGWWLLQTPDPAPESDTDTADVGPATEPQIACTVENALTGDAPALDMLKRFADRSDAGTCDPPVTADFARRVVEQAVVNGDAAAMAAIGDIYNPFYTHPLLSDRLDVRLSDAPDIAFDFYLRTIEAGQSPNAGALQALCDGTEDSTDFLVRQNRQELCQ